MAKIIKYKFVAGEENHGTKEIPNIEQILLDKIMTWSEVNEEIAKREAYHGYTIEDDGQPEPERPITDADRIAELEEALAMLLSGVTE